jgi:hypothetical protein
MDGWMDGRTDGRTDGWMDGRTDGWMDGGMGWWIDHMLTSVSFFTEQKVQTLILKESLVVLPFIGKANATLNELKALIEAVGSELQVCADKGLVNGILCASSLVSEAKSQVEEIVSDIKAEVQQAKEILEKIVRDGKAAVESFVESAKQSVEDIRAEVEQCIRDSLQQS